MADLPAGDSIEPPQPDRTEVAQILFGEQPQEQEDDGEADSESDQPVAAATDEPDQEQAAEGEGESQETPEESEPEPKFDKSMYGLEVPLGDELGAKSIGELKDFYQRNQDWQTEQARTTEEMDSQRYELVQARQELGALIEMVGPHATPELVNKIGEDRRSTIAKETQLLLKAKPEWRENARYMADREALEGFVGKFGISQNEFRSATDHRLILMADQARRDRQALDDARAQLDKLRTTKTPPKVAKSSRGKNGRFQGKQQRPQGRDSETAAVADLLGQAGIFKGK